MYFICSLFNKLFPFTILYIYLYLYKTITLQYLEAIQLCNEYDIPITEDLIEKLTPITNHLSNHDLSNIFIKLGELCLINEYYYLACKKFTQAGNYISAIKSLIKSGDIEKIIFFTNISKQKEIYIITANYLQTINNWHKNINIIRNIIQFYIRGQAMESLITFYETCAHVCLYNFI